MNDWQIKPFDGFGGNFTRSRWTAIAKCSPDTVLRDINDLLARGVRGEKAQHRV